MRFIIKTRDKCRICGLKLTALCVLLVMNLKVIINSVCDVKSEKCRCEYISYDPDIESTTVSLTLNGAWTVWALLFFWVGVEG